MPGRNGLSRCGLVSLFVAAMVTGVSNGQGVAFTFTQLDVQNWEVTAVVTGDTANTAGFAGYAFDIFAGDPTQMTWTQDDGLIGLDDNLLPFGFTSTGQGVCCDTGPPGPPFFAVGAVIPSSDGVVVPGIGLSPVNIAGCCGDVTDVNTDIPVVLGILTVDDGTILTSGDIEAIASIYSMNPEPPLSIEDFIPSDETPITIEVIPLPEPASLLLLTIPALLLRRRDSMLRVRDRS